MTEKNTFKLGRTDLDLDNYAQITGVYASMLENIDLYFNDLIDRIDGEKLSHADQMCIANVQRYLEKFRKIDAAERGLHNG